MATPIKKLADELVPEARKKGLVVEGFDAVRDWADLKTGSELDTIPLDLLADEIMRRLKSDDQAAS